MSVRALIYVPSPDQEGLTDAERLAIRVRNAATITGVCARRLGDRMVYLYAIAEIRDAA